MKKILFTMLAVLCATQTFAAVQVKLNNVPNDAKVFIASFDDGKTIYATRVGQYAVVPDSKINMYLAYSAFAVGLDRGAVLQNCATSITGVSQFFFKYHDITNTVISLSLKKYHGKTVAVCNLIK